MSSVLSRLRDAALRYNAKEVLAPWPGWTCAWNVAENGDAESLVRLIDTDPTLLNRKNRRGETLLHAAVGNGKVKCVAALLELGAKSEASAFGETPLRVAVEKGFSEIARMLCEREEGISTAELSEMLFIASENGSQAVADVLHRKIDPTLHLSKEEDIPNRERETQRPGDEKDEPPAIAETALVSNPKSWAPIHLQRWLESKLDESDKSRLSLDLIRRFHISGRVFLNFERNQVKIVFERLGIPAQTRNYLLKRVAEELSLSRGYQFTEKRRLPVAVGDALHFRIIGTISVAMSTPLYTVRHLICFSKENLDFEPPENFCFISMNNELVAKEDERKTIVAGLGFIVILSPI